jgi:DNA-directed RNA polymerase subunit omega
MAQVPIEELLKQCRSIYQLVVVAAKRAKELSAGAPKLVETDIKKITTIALEEIRHGKILYKEPGHEAAKGEHPPSRAAGRTKRRLTEAKKKA